MYTSLVFLVVLGIWAAYLIQHWLRRREHLLTARSVDAFNEALRVLERRPSATTSTPRPRSYAVSPLRTQPGVVVKHGGATSVRAAQPAATTDPRLRVAGLAGCALLMLLAVVGLVLGHVGPLVPIAALLLLAGDIAYLRWSARLRSSSRRSTAAAPRVTPVATRTEASAPVERVEPAAPAPAPEAPVDTTVAPFDVRAFDEPAPAPVVEEPPAPGTWRPTPVPAPLYTRKAAVQPAPAPVVLAPVAESDTYLSPVSIDDDLDVDLLDMPSPFGRVVNG